MKTLIDNVARFPAQTLNNFRSAPVLLRDESVETLRKVAQIWTREGLRARVLELAEMDGITPSIKGGSDACMRCQSYRSLIH
jgi:hypothetical protein